MSGGKIKDVTDVPTQPVSPVVLLQKDPILDAVSSALKAKQKADDKWVPGDQPDLEVTPKESPISFRVNLCGILLEQQPERDLEALGRTRRQLQ